MNQRIVVVTGGTDGIGKQTVHHLAQAGAHVVLTGRNKPRVDAAVAAVQAAVPTASVEGVSFDLGSLAAVRSGASLLAGKLSRIDALINNAGIFANERVLTADGYEATWAVNFIAPVVLTHLLLPALQKSSAPLVLNVASIAHTRGRIHHDDPSLAANFTGYAAYAQSKLGNVIHALWLAQTQPWLCAASMHPGVIATKLLRLGFGPVRGAPADSAAAVLTELGLGTRTVPSGSYLSDGEITPPAAAATDPATRSALFESLAPLLRP